MQRPVVCTLFSLRCSCWQPCQVCYGHPRSHLGLPGSWLTLGCSTQAAEGAGGARTTAGIICTHRGNQVPGAQSPVADSAEVQVRHWAAAAQAS